MTRKFLSKEVMPLLPDQKPMNIPKVAGYILNIHAKLITNNQTIYTNGYDLTIRQIPLSEGYFKMNYNEDKKIFNFESLYRIDLSGDLIDQYIGQNEIGVSVKIEGQAKLDYNATPEINNIEILMIYEDDQNIDKKELINDLFMNDNIIKLLEDNDFYELDVISMY